MVTCLGLGGYHIGWTTEALAAATIEAALAGGVRFFDTAESYGPHTSEERYGKYLVPKARDQIFLMTKSGAKTASAAREHLEGSLRRMKTDVIDLWQLHSLNTVEDVESRLQEGVLSEAVKAREESKIRFIGFTGHASPYAHERILELTDGDPDVFAACQFPVNPVDAASKNSFISRVFPAAQKRNIGVIAMKTLADGRLFPEKMMGDRQVWKADPAVIPSALSLEECFHYALSLPIATLVTGAEKPEFLTDKITLVQSFTQLDESARAALVSKVADFASGGKVEYYKAEELRG